MTLIGEAAERIWTPDGRGCLDYLRRRGLEDETIRAARLGWSPRVAGVPWKPPGLVVPWLDEGRLALVKVRPPDEWRERFPKDKRPPKYIETFRDRPVIYPGREAIQPGEAVIICEGELDTLLMAQQLQVPVITLGSASGKADAEVLALLLFSSPWYVAHDADPAGDASAAAWPAGVIRVRPPDPDKDWGDVHAGGRAGFVTTGGDCWGIPCPGKRSSRRGSCHHDSTLVPSLEEGGSRSTPVRLHPGPDSPFPGRSAACRPRAPRTSHPLERQDRTALASRPPHRSSWAVRREAGPDRQSFRETRGELLLVQVLAGGVRSPNPRPLTVVVQGLRGPARFTGPPHRAGQRRLAVGPAGARSRNRKQSRPRHLLT